jgi:predicted DNA-binding ribbon-helix-helix protein
MPRWNFLAATRHNYDFKPCTIIPRFSGGTTMKSSISKRSIIIGGHKTSVSLEDAFWQAVRDIAKNRGETISSLVGSIDADRQQGNLSSAIRLFVLGVYCNSTDPQGGARASLAE